MNFDQFIKPQGNHSSTSTLNEPQQEENPNKENSNTKEESVLPRYLEKFPKKSADMEDYFQNAFESRCALLLARGTTALSAEAIINFEKKDLQTRLKWDKILEAEFSLPFLFKAIEIKDFVQFEKFIKAYLQNKGNINIKHLQQTILSHEIENFSKNDFALNRIELLLKSDINPNIGTAHWTPFLVATSRSIETDLWHLLLRYGAIVEQSNFYGVSPLSIALHHNQIKAALFMLIKGVPLLYSSNFEMQILKRMLPEQKTIEDIEDPEDLPDIKQRITHPTAIKIVNFLEKFSIFNLSNLFMLEPNDFKTKEDKNIIAIILRGHLQIILEGLNIFPEYSSPLTLLKDDLAKALEKLVENKHSFYLVKNYFEPEMLFTIFYKMFGPSSKYTDQIEPKARKTPAKERKKNDIYPHFPFSKKEEIILVAIPEQESTLTPMGPNLN